MLPCMSVVASTVRRIRSAESGKLAVANKSSRGRLERGRMSLQYTLAPTRRLWQDRGRIIRTYLLDLLATTSLLAQTPPAAAPPKPAAPTAPAREPRLAAPLTTA